MQASSVAQGSAESHRMHSTLHLHLGVDLLYALNFRQSAKTYKLLKHAQAVAQLLDPALYNTGLDLNAAGIGLMSI